MNPLLQGNAKTAALLALPGPRRYEHFIKAVADGDEVWGLFRDGWALVGEDSGERAFPLWPASEFAALCAEGDWNGYVAEAFSVDDLLEELLPMLERDGLRPCVFLTPEDQGVVVSSAQLARDLRAELARF